MNLIIQPNQSILDAVLTRYGSLEAAMAFCSSNGISLSSMPASGTQFSAPVVKGNAIAKRYLSSRNILIGTAGNGVCGMVTGLTLTDVAYTTATASFVAGEGAIALEWAVAVSEPESGTVISASITTMELDGLAQATETKFWIRTVCSDSVSSWVVQDFVTLGYSMYMQLVLRPVHMYVSIAEGLLPGLVLDYMPHASFTNVYPLLEDWQPPANMRRTTKEEIDTGVLLFTAETVGLTSISGNMTSKMLQVQHSLSSMSGTTNVWYPTNADFPDDCFPIFIDVEGNKAICAPVIVEDTLTANRYNMQGLMEFNDGYVEGDIYKLPIDISHTGDNPFLTLIHMKLLINVGGIYEVIEYPMPGETVIAYLPIGRHELVLCSIYQSVDGPDPMPASFNGVVLDIIGYGCSLVTGLDVTDITSTTAVASFIAGAGAIGLEWAFSDTMPETGTEISAAATSQLLEGLTPVSEYRFWIRTICEDGVSAWISFPFTTAEPTLTMQMVLNPVMMHVEKELVDYVPDYLLNCTVDVDFYNRYDLVEDWQPPTYIYRTTKEMIDEYGSEGVIGTFELTSSSGNMASKTLQLLPPLLTIPGSITVALPWSVDLPENAFPKFIDVEGNRAVCAPVIVNGPEWGTLYTMLGTMNFGSGYVVDGSYKQPITIGHVGDNSFFNIHSVTLLKWVGDHYEAIAEPIIGETVIVTLSLGRHELLLGVNYQSVDATEAFPTSYNGVVLDIIEE